MKIAISGTSGLVGSGLSNYLPLNLDCEVLPISRSMLYGDVNNLAQFLEGCDVVIHLSGASILQRWTLKAKQLIWESRITTTRNLVSAFAKMKKVPSAFISTSACGCFDVQGMHDENSEKWACDFLGQLCFQWENEAMKASQYGVRTSVFRFGVVLSPLGGVLKKVVSVFKLGFGGRVGSGSQPFPFVHVEDLLRAYVHVLQNDGCKGFYHLVAPELVTNKDFTQTMSRVLNRPAWFSLPSWILKGIYGEGAQVMTQGQRILTKRLHASGFEYKYPSLDSSLANLLE